MDRPAGEQGLFRPEERLELIAELLGAAPTRSGTFGREAAAAFALATNQDRETVARLLDDAHKVGSSAAGSCLVRVGGRSLGGAEVVRQLGERHTGPSDAA